MEASTSAGILSSHSVGQGEQMQPPELQVFQSGVTSVHTTALSPTGRTMECREGDASVTSARPYGLQDMASLPQASPGGRGGSEKVRLGKESCTPVLDAYGGQIKLSLLSLLELQLARTWSKCHLYFP